MNFFKLLTFSILSLVLFASCGYKPTIHYAQKELQKDVFVDLQVSLTDPKNTVFIKDTVTKILIQRLGSRMVDTKLEADVIMDLSISSVTFSALQYDKDGYNKLYKANVVISVKYFDKATSKTKAFKVDGEYDFVVEKDSSINDSHRYEAITEASNMAMDEILSKIAVLSFR